MRLQGRFVFLAAALAFASAPVVVGFSSGPPGNSAGVCRARPSCSQGLCHIENPVPSGTAFSTLELETGPLPPSPTYRIGELFRFVVAVADPDLTRSRIGFQLAAVADCPFATEAGTITVTELGRTGSIVTGGITFLRHECPFPECGYEPVVGPTEVTNRWAFDWQAPDEYVGPVSFYWAVNAADGSFDENGDFITLWSANIQPACPRRVDDLLLRATTCDPAAPTVTKVELIWTAAPSATDGYRAYRTDSASALLDPPALATQVTECDSPPPGAIHYYTVAGVCVDLLDGPF